MLFRGAVELLEVGADCLPLLDEARQDGVPGPGFNRHTGTEQAASDSSRLGVEQAWIDLHALREERTEAERRVGALI